MSNKKEKVFVPQVVDNMALTQVKVGSSPIQSIEEADEELQKLKKFINKEMKKNEDYGRIPGTSKPTLYKPGAEKLIDFHGFSVHFEQNPGTVIDWDKMFFNYDFKCILIHPLSGRTIEGVGSCNSKEKKYRNQDTATIVNTIEKMGKKRALVDATLTATRASFYFTQDIEDLKDDDEEKKPVSPVNITPEQIKELTKLAKEVGYHNPSFELYKTQADYEAVKGKFKKLKEQIDKINTLRKERDLQPEFEEKYKDVQWDKLFTVKLDRLLGIIEDLKQQPLANEIEQVKPKKSTKTEKIQSIKDGLTELGYTESSPEVTKMLQPYGAFNVKQLDSLSNAKLDEILKVEFAQE